MVCAIDSACSSKHAKWGFEFVGPNRFAVQNIFIGSQKLSPRGISSTRTNRVYHIIRKPETRRFQKWQRDSRARSAAREKGRTIAGSISNCR